MKCIIIYSSSEFDSHFHLKNFAILGFFSFGFYFIAYCSFSNLSCFLVSKQETTSFIIFSVFYLASFFRCSTFCERKWEQKRWHFCQEHIMNTCHFLLQILNIFLVLVWSENVFKFFLQPILPSLKLRLKAKRPPYLCSRRSSSLNSIARKRPK